ncbi:hypothetical protein FRB99_005365 [Tulasnella sp. 403]|nr:hypothetical protein FRB99_005365 [Tulasnella sp. 403]
MSVFLKSPYGRTVPSLCRGFVARPKHTIKDPLATAPNAVTTELAPGLTFIHRPPPTAESPVSYTSNPASPLLRPTSSQTSTSRQYGTLPALNNSSTPLPPTVRPISPRFNPQTPQSFHLTQAQIDEIRTLRASDPKKNTVWKLAEQFKCSRLFISMVAPLKDIKIQVKGADGEIVETSEAERRQAERVKREARWGERKKITREVSKKRKALW